MAQRLINDVGESVLGILLFVQVAQSLKGEFNFDSGCALLDCSSEINCFVVGNKLVDFVDGDCCDYALGVLFYNLNVECVCGGDTKVLDVIEAEFIVEEVVEDEVEFEVGGGEEKFFFEF